MGNAVSVRRPGDGTPSLDDLGGYYRPAVLRKDELDAKTAWLGNTLLAQADQMEALLDLNKKWTTKEQTARLTGQRLKPTQPSPAAVVKRQIGFGGAVTRPATADKPARTGRRPPPQLPPPGGAAGQGSRPGTSQEPVRPGSVGGPRPGTTQGRSTVTGRALPVRLAGRTPSSTLAGGDPFRPGTAGAAVGGGDAVAAYATWPGGHVTPVAAAPSPYKQPGVGVPLGPAARKKAAAAAAAAKAAKAAEEEYKAAHWRGRVQAAKRRLYLYLVAYMAWVSVLKKKRVGYADPLPVDVLPIYLSNALGDLTNQVGQALLAFTSVVENAASDTHRSLSVLNGGRMWLSRARAHQAAGAGGAVTRAPSGTTLASRVSGASSTTEPAQSVLPPKESVAFVLTGARSGHSSTSPGGGAASAPATPTGGGGRVLNPRGGARALVPTGAGARALTHAVAAPQQQPAAVLPAALQPFRHQAGLESGTGHGGGRTGGAAAQQAGTSQPPSTPASPIKSRKSYAPVDANVPRNSRLITPDVYQREVEAVRRLTALYIKRGKQKSHVNKDLGDFAFLAQPEQASLQVLLNKASARWAERRLVPAAEGLPALGWHPPVVLDVKTLAAGGVDVSTYSKVSGSLLAAGKVAVMMTFVGEELAMGQDTLATGHVTEPAIHCDLWRGVQQLFAHKLPSTPYLSGLTLLDRRVLQCIIDVERHGGGGALTTLTILLSVDSAVTSWVAEQAAARGHWGLQPHQVVIVSIARLPGMSWDATAKIFKLNFSSNYSCAGSGYGLLALAWPSHSFTMTPSGREYVAGSTLQLLASRGVQYVYSTLLCDAACLTPACPAVDPSFVGPAVYAMDIKGANMAMHVASSNAAALSRTAQSVVVAPAPQELFCCNLPTSDLQSAATRAMLASQAGAGAIVSCMSRYLFQVQHLQRALTGPNAFRLKIQAANACLHASLDMADVTTHITTKAVAVLGKAPCPAVNVKELPRDWLRDLVPSLAAQDMQPAMRVRLAKLSAVARPVVSGMTIAAAQDALPRAVKGPAGSNLLLFVKDNAASRLAFKLVMALLGPRDVLTIVTVVQPDVQEADAQALLGSFSDVLASQQIVRKVVRQRDKLVDTMLGEVDSLQPDLVAVGSMVLSDNRATTQSGGGLGANNFLVSVAVSLAKSLVDTPLLIVKTNTSGELLKAVAGAPAMAGAAMGPKKVVIEVTSVQASLTMLRWVGARLLPDRDKLVLVKPNAIDKATGKEALTAQRLTQAFTSEAHALRFGSYAVKKVPLAEGPAEGIPDLCVSERADILGIVAPTSKATPAHVTDLMRTARTAVLIWRQRAAAPESP